MWNGDRLRLGLLIVGFLLIPTGVFLALRKRPARNPDYKYSIAYVTKRRLIEPSGPGDVGRPVRFLVKAPKTLHVGESASVSATARKIEFLEGRDSVNPLELNLAAAGLEIEPKGWVRLHFSEDGEQWVAEWSMHATSPGSYRLVFNPRLEWESSDARGKVAATRTQDLLMRTIVEFNFSPQADLTVEVVRGWRDWASMAAGPFTGFMGSLLTLPGILALGRRWKRAREARKEKSKELPVFE